MRDVSSGDRCTRFILFVRVWHPRVGMVSGNNVAVAQSVVLSAVGGKRGKETIMIPFLSIPSQENTRLFFKKLATIFREDYI